MERGQFDSESLGTYAKGLDNVDNTMGNLGKTFSRIGSEIRSGSRGTADALKNLGDAGERAGVKLGAIETRAKSLETTLGRVKYRAKEFGEEAKKLGDNSKVLASGIDKAATSTDSLLTDIVRAIPVVGPLGAVLLKLSFDIEAMGKMALRTSSQIALGFGKGLPASLAGAVTSSGDMSRSINSLSQTVLNLRNVYGLSTEEIASGLQSMGTAFPMDVLKEGSGLLGTLQEGFRGFQEAVVLAHQSGLNLNETVEFLNSSYLELGSAGLGEAEKSLANVLSLSDKTGLSHSRVIGMTLDVARAYAMYGISAENAGVSVTKVAKALGPGSLGLAGRLVQSIAGGMLGMARGGQAFFGMRAGMGPMPLQAALQFQQRAQAGPAGLMDALQAVSKGIIGASGARGIVTLKQAAAPGVGEGLARQFYVQQELLSSQLNISRAEAQRSLEVLAVLESGGKLNKDQEKTLEDIRKAQEEHGDPIAKTAAFAEITSKGIMMLVGKFDVAGPLSGISDALQGYMTGRLGPDDLMKALKNVPGMGGPMIVIQGIHDLIKDIRDGLNRFFGSGKTAAQAQKEDQDHWINVGKIRGAPVPGTAAVGFAGKDIIKSLGDQVKFTATDGSRTN